MVVERKPGQDDSRESGQSIVEFLLMLPMLVGLVLILLRVNTAIQVSIVDQQYARSHALWLNFNSPVYPQLALREPHLTAQQDNQMVIGVSDNVAPEDGSNFQPVASTSYVARKKGQADSSDPESSKRANVRIRDTVTICTQSNVVQGKGGMVPALPLDPKTFAPTGNSVLTEDPHQFNYCGSNMQYVVDAQDTGT
jgi:hypothetical protein